MNSKGKGNPNPKELSSRGVPSTECLWLDSLGERECEWQKGFSLGLKLENILQLVFPKKYQPVYYDISLSFMRLVLSKRTVFGSNVKEMLLDYNFSKATFYNKILPRLKSVGMIKVVKRKDAYSQSSKTLYTYYTYDTSFSDFFQVVCNDYKRVIRLAETGHTVAGGVKG
ncbi:MAG: hypothetical protein U9P44_00570 [archaeon]|nr:hypothetical protein [archaeon]